MNISMKMKRSLIMCGVLSLVSLGSAYGAAHSVKYPNKPITLIASFAPGSAVDMSARVVAAYATKKWGVTVNVQNVIGASGVTGTLQVLNAKPDGYTLLLETATQSSFLFATQTNLPMKIDGRDYVAMVTTDPMYFFANTGTGWKTLKDAINFLQTKPEQFAWGAGAYSSYPMLSQVRLFNVGGVTMETIKKSKMVVFQKGNAPSIQACITGDVQFAMGWTYDVSSVLATGKVAVLAVNAPERTKDFPNIPTTKELGYADAILVPWYGISGPKGLPNNVVKAWNNLLKDAASDPVGQAEAAKAKKIWTYLPDAEFKAHVMNEYEKTIPIATALGLRK